MNRRWLTVLELVQSGLLARVGVVVLATTLIPTRVWLPLLGLKSRCARAEFFAVVRALEDPTAKTHIGADFVPNATKRRIDSATSSVVHSRGALCEVAKGLSIETGFQVSEVWALRSHICLEHSR
eukprot:2405802-Amphidinium_carterae.2